MEHGHHRGARRVWVAGRLILLGALGGTCQLLPAGMHAVAGHLVAVPPLSCASWPCLFTNTLRRPPCRRGGGG